MGWREFWAEVRRPEAGASPYRWAAIACGHVVIGQAFAGLLVLAGMVWGAIPVTLVVYWIAKEIDDLARGASLLDSVVDAGFVALGAACALWPWLMPGVVAAMALGVTLHGRWTQP